MEKRKKEDESECETRKRPKIEKIALTDFPDDILLVILRHLNHDGLLALSRTCEQFRRICQDHTLWKEVDFGSRPASVEDVEGILECVTEETGVLRVGGWNGGKNHQELKEVISDKWLETLGEKCRNLHTLELPYHHINCDHIMIHHFPKTLTRLDLSHTHLTSLPVNRSYFKDISRLIPNLKSLILSHCKWFEPHSLMAISKCEQLEELQINDCPQVKDCLAYCGLSTRGGFRSLKTLDMRRCYLNCSELVCFSSVVSIVNLYLENPWVDPPRMCHIDRAIVMLFTQQDVVEIRMVGLDEFARRNYLQIERLVVRNFPLMTDASLYRLASDAKSLCYLDVTGSGVTADGIRQFKLLRPNVQVVSEVADE